MAIAIHGKMDELLNVVCSHASLTHVGAVCARLKKLI